MDEMIDLVTPEMLRPKYRHDDKMYGLISDNMFFLNTFSRAGSTHDFILDNRHVQVTMRFFGQVHEDGVHSQYAGPIVVYEDEIGCVWLQPKFEFLALFEKVEQQ